MLFKLQALLWVGLYIVFNPNMATSLPIEFVNKDSINTIKYPIHVACECKQYELYVDGKFIEQAGAVEGYLESDWNATKIFSPGITTETPKIIAFHGIGGLLPGFANGFIMDMNNGADYTKYQEWKCMEFGVSAVPANWYMYDYDDSLWEMSKSYGMNYQNNSYQIFEHERFSIHLNAEWLWTQNNAKTNIFCRKKNKHVQSPIHVHVRVPLTTSAPPTHIPTTQTSVMKTTHHIPAQTAAPIAKLPIKIKPDTQNIYYIKNNIKIIINNAKVSKNIIDKQIFNMFRYLHVIKSDNDDDNDNDDNDDDKLRREIYYIVKQIHTHIHHHYDHILNYYKKILQDSYDSVHDGSDQYERDENEEKAEKREKRDKGEKKEIFKKNDSRLKKTSKIIESMIKLNHYIKVIEYKIQFIKGETKYNLLQILYSLRKQYQDDMSQMLKFL